MSMIDLADLPCTDCGYGTISDEYYMVRNAVWERAIGVTPIPNFDDTILCIGCLERRIGRTLTRYDFTDCAINNDPEKSERLRNRMKRGRRIDFALTFAQAGFPIFPVNVFRRGERWRKVPYVHDWANAATTDPRQIGEWWMLWPLAMPALPLSRCGLVVVDADRHPGGADGVAAFHELGLMPRHPIATTKSGGEHHFFRQPPSPISKEQNWRLGIDLLGASSFVVGYAVPEGEIPELPDVFCRSERNPRSVVSLNGGAPPHHDPVVVADLTTALRKMNVCEWNGKHVEGGMLKEWYELLLGCKYVGISEADFIEWCVSDPDYAQDAEDIACHWHHARAKHGGAFWRELSKRGIKVRHVGGDGQLQRHNTSKVPPTEAEADPTSQPNLRRASARINSAISAIDRDPTERCLFWASCLCAEIVHECKLSPTQIVNLIAGNAYPAMRKTLGKEGIRRTIANAFRHVEEKYLEQPDGQKGKVADA
jgi:hypothetical protein